MFKFEHFKLQIDNNNKKKLSLNNVKPAKHHPDHHGRLKISTETLTDDKALKVTRGGGTSIISEVEEPITNTVNYQY